MKLLISAAEASSDTHAAAFIKALKALWAKEFPHEPLDIQGVAGPRLQSEGVQVWVDARELLTMGFAEALKAIPAVLRSLKVIENKVETWKPDLGIVFDYPEFHMKMVQRLQPHGIPFVYMIPPKVWVWRSHRVLKLKKLFKKLLVIFPFEKAFYQKMDVDVTYVGNPLLDELPLQVSKSEAREKLGLKNDELALVIMPGSRPSELHYHLKPLILSAYQIQQSVDQKLKVFIPLALTQEVSAIQKVLDHIPESKKLDLILSSGDAWSILRAADAGIIKSGTSTLEAALLGCPHVVIYDASLVSKWIFKYLIRYKKPVSLVNLIENGGEPKERIVTELILEKFTVENISNEILPLLQPEHVKRKKMLSQFQVLYSLLTSNLKESHSPSFAAARVVIDLYKKNREVKL